MPHIRFTIAGNALGADQRRELMATFTDEVHRRLGKRREVTAVTVCELPSGNWAVDGRCVNGASAHVEIAVTAGSNTPAQKADMIAAADACLRRTLGVLPEATYVVIHEIAAEAWGYGGRTQAARSLARGGL